MVTTVRAIPSHPRTPTAVAVENKSAGPTHNKDLKYLDVKEYFILDKETNCY